MKNYNKTYKTPEWSYKFSMPMCLSANDEEDLVRFSEFVTPYFDNLFGSEEFGECLWGDVLPDEVSEEERNKIETAEEYASDYNRHGCYNFKDQPWFFANLIKIHKLTGEYALERYIDDLEFDIHEYTKALRKYVKKLVKEDE